MIHVPDVDATTAWYQAIGFTLIGSHECESGGPLDWAALRLGDSEIMLNIGGQPSNAERREVDLYIDCDDVDALHDRLKGTVEVVAEPYDAFHGNRELIIRDLNRFWITFAHPVRG